LGIGEDKKFYRPDRDFEVQRGVEELRHRADNGVKIAKCCFVKAGSHPLLELEAAEALAEELAAELGLDEPV